MCKLSYCSLNSIFGNIWLCWEFSLSVVYTDVAIVSSSSIYRIQPVDLELTPTGQPTSLHCQLETSDDFRLQYVTWSKISRDDEARREFVYHYDRCTGDDQSYGTLVGRARVNVTTQPSANAVSRQCRRFYVGARGHSRTGPQILSQAPKFLTGSIVISLSRILASQMMRGQPPPIFSPRTATVSRFRISFTV